jgi:hypothetical protein
MRLADFIGFEGQQNEQDFAEALDHWLLVELDRPSRFNAL